MLCYFREMALRAASSAPLLARPKRSVQSNQAYPYVFDALAESHRATAFISDTKVSCVLLTWALLTALNIIRI